VVGSVAINLARGTGWRGLAVMNRPRLVRPLLGWTKRDIYDYARDNRLEWVEDSTNAEPKYLRNRLRRDVLAVSEVNASQLLKLRQAQIDLSLAIEQETAQLLTEMAGSRYAYTMVPETVAVQLLRAECERVMGTGPMAAQLQRAVLAIKTARAGTSHDVGGGCRLAFTSRNFVVYPADKMVQ
jgi:tRNA(Ile)-lysidine synthase